MGGGENPLLFDIQTALGARSGLGCRSGALSRVLVLEPGKALLGLLCPNRGAGFGLQRVAFRSLPHPSLGAYKRGSAELLESLLFALGLALLQNIIGVRLPERTSSLRA